MQGENERRGGKSVLDVQGIAIGMLAECKIVRTLTGG